jgi:hypothetical protein
VRDKLVNIVLSMGHQTTNVAAKVPLGQK